MINNEQDKTISDTENTAGLNNNSNGLQAVDNSRMSADDHTNIVDINSNKGMKKNPVYNNLDMLTTEEARIRGRNGGKKSGETRRQKKTMRETLQDALQIELSPDKLQELGADMSLLNGQNTVLSAIIASTIREAINGDTKAIQFVRDSIGEQPKQEIVQEVITKDDIELIDDLKTLLSS